MHGRVVKALQEEQEALYGEATTVFASLTDLEWVTDRVGKGAKLSPTSQTLSVTQESVGAWMQGRLVGPECDADVQVNAYVRDGHWLISNLTLNYTSAPFGPVTPQMQYSWNGLGTDMYQPPVNVTVMKSRGLTSVSSAFFGS